MQIVIDKSACIGFWDAMVVLLLLAGGGASGKVLQCQFPASGWFSRLGANWFDCRSRRRLLSCCCSWEIYCASFTIEIILIFCGSICFQEKRYCICESGRRSDEGIKEQISQEYTFPLTHSFQLISHNLILIFCWLLCSHATHIGRSLSSTSYFHTCSRKLKMNGEPSTPTTVKEWRWSIAKEVWKHIFKQNY